MLVIPKLTLRIELFSHKYSVWPHTTFASMFGNPIYKLKCSALITVTCTICEVEVTEAEWSWVTDPEADWSQVAEEEVTASPVATAKSFYSQQEKSFGQWNNLGSSTIAGLNCMHMHVLRLLVTLEWPIKITMQLQLVIALVAERSKVEQGLVIVM